VSQDLRLLQQIADLQYRLGRVEEALGEAMEWNWLDEDMPKDVRERIESVYEDSAVEGQKPKFNVVVDPDMPDDEVRLIAGDKPENVAVATDIVVERQCPNKLVPGYQCALNEGHEGLCVDLPLPEPD